MATTVHEAQLNDDLKKYGVTRFARENNTIQIVFENERVVIFDIHPKGVFKTIENLMASAKNEKIGPVVINKVVVVLLNEQNDYLKFLLVSGNGNNKDGDAAKKEEEAEQSNINNNNNNNDANNSTTAKEEPEELSVSETIRRKEGYVRVKGQVIGHSSVYDMIVTVKLRCDSCGFDKNIDYSKKPVFRSPVKDLSRCPTKSCNEEGLTLRAIPEYITTIDVELQDPDKFNEIERVKVRLFEDDTKDVFAGKIVMITGDIHVVRENDNPSNKPTPVIYGNSIEDIKKEQSKLTEKDIEEVLDWKKSKEAEYKSNNNNNNIIDKLVSYFAPDIIGYEHVKKGLLMVAANAGIPNNEKRIPKRLRINALLIGDPSLAKSTIIRKAVNIIPNARYESCQSSTGLSLTAQVSKEEGGIYTLRHGPIPLANGSVCALNEIGQMHISEHKHFLDCMQEGYFTLNKHGFNAPISANTSIIASANPINNTWKDPENIEQSEFPTLTQIIHRFDFIFIFRENRDADYLRKYTRQREEAAKKSDEGAFDNYDNFLRRYLMYARTFEPAFSEEARAMLNDYLVNIADAGVTGLPRKLESLESTAIALAKLRLKNVVEAEDATETMEFFNVILLHFKQTAIISKNPRDVAYNECVSILKESSFPISSDELIKLACQKNEQVKRYIGDKFDLENNKKVRQVMDLLRQDSMYIKVISQRPLALVWIKKEKSHIKISHLSDPADLADPDMYEENKKLLLEKDNENENEPVGGRSDRSDRSDSRCISSNDSSITNITRHSSSSIYKPIVSIDEFFNQNIDYQRLPPHTVEQSPCYPIIIIKENGEESYRCKLHCSQGYESTDLDTIEYHCKTQDPDKHKAEILRLLKEKEKEETAAAITNNNNIVYSQIILRNCLSNQQQQMIR